MAGANNYKLLLEAQLDSSKVQSQINALSNKSVLNIKAQFQKDDIAKFEQELNRIRAVAASVGKVTLFGDSAGGINKAVVEYTDKIGNVKTEYLKINESAAITQKYVQNIAKDEKEVAKLKQETVKLTAKQADEMQRAALNAEKFLARSKNMASTPTVRRAQDTAGQIQQAVSDGDIARVRKLNDELAVQKSALQQTTVGMAGWVNGIQSAIKRVAELALGVGLVYGALNQLRKGVDYVSELNKEMTKIQVLQIEGARTNEEISNLAVRYNDLAKSVGATTIEVAQGSVEWLRQGKTIEETQGLLRSTMMLSKLGALDSAEATEYLTSILNGYQMSSEQASTVVDKLVAVDNKAATSAGELATALQYVSAVAKQTGVEFDEMVSIIATISSVTRVSAETIGQGMKTMLTRMQDIRWKGIDETGVSINNVEKALRDVDIALRDTPESFRPLGDVLKDLSTKWNTLSETQQANISKAIAGTRQVNLFTVLMQNYNKVLEFNEI